jgi:hypothetical protein
MKEFTMRGKTASDTYETLNFGGDKSSYGFVLTEFKLWPSVDAVLAGGDFNMRGAVTRGKDTNFTSNAPNFSQEGLIANAWFRIGNTNTETLQSLSLVDDTALITQDIILHVIDVGSSAAAVNWQCKFMPVKLNTSEQALANYRQFSIFDE